MKQNECKMYRSTKNNDVATWTIWSEGNEIKILTQQSIGASAIPFVEKIENGLAGRTIEQQIKLRINSRVNNKLNHGYTTDFEVARKGTMKNQLNLNMPMLAERFKNIKNWNIEDMFVQNKLDGHRCLIARLGGEYIAYSRGGLVINTIDHILEGLEFEDDFVLDGELYCHGIKLQTISSWAKRKQPNTLRLKFHAYDAISPFDDPYEDRLKFLREQVNWSKNSHSLDTIDGKTYDEDFSISQHLKASCADGYEGLILRPKKGMYQIGRRSKSLIKVKRYDIEGVGYEDEFKVIDVTKSRSGLAVLHCETANGTRFKATAPGARINKDHVLHNKQEYIGQLVNVEYAELTNDGKPFQPVATRWVTKL